MNWGLRFKAFFASMGWRVSLYCWVSVLLILFAARDILSSGRLLGSLADAANSGSFMSMQQILYDVLGFAAASAATAVITIYAKRALQSLQTEDELA